MKKAGAILLVSLYGLGLVRPAMPLIEYYFKLEEYKAQCINKAKPRLHCDGKCHLMEKLKVAAGEKPSPSCPAPVKINFEDYPIALLAKISSMVASIQSSEKLYPPQRVAIIGTPVFSIFHPPQTS